MESPVRELVAWKAAFTAVVRAFLDEQGFLEVDTPSLAPFLVPEPSIPAFESRYLPGRGPARPLWLTPSPELWMKRLLGRGSGSIYQLAHAFRNGDFGSPVHNPEFRLLEWYAVGRDYMHSIALTEGLVGRLLDAGLCRGDAGTLAPPFRRLSVEEAFERHAGIALAAAQDDAALLAACRARGLAVAGDCTWEEAYHIAFLTLVEPALPRDRPLVLMDYPARIRTTARRRAGTPWSERWELYAGGVELANCYTEETDPAALREMIREEEARLAGLRVVPAADHGLVEGFAEAGPVIAQPLITGNALGLDRLEMLFRGEKSLEGVILFPFSAIFDGQSDSG